MKIAVNTVSKNGWGRVYKMSTDVRIRHEPGSETDDFYLALEMKDGAVRYLVGTDDEAKRMDSKQLSTFLRRYTEVDSFALKLR